MTTIHIDCLMTLWGLDPQPPVLRDPWDLRRDPSGQDRTVKRVHGDRPDFGWALAQRIASCSRQCPILRRQEYRWIRAAINFLNGDATAARHLREVDIVSKARDLYESDAVRHVLNATLMTREATAATVAEALKISSAVVEAYADLFFNVLDRKDDFVFLQTILGNGKSDSLFMSKSSLPSDEESLLVTGFNGSIMDVLRDAGLSNEDGEESEDALARQMTRKLLKAGVKYLSSPAALKQRLPAIVSHAIDIAKKSKVEQQPIEDDVSGDFATAARDVLSGDAMRLRRAVQACLEEPTSKS
jgi:hypothetical protein